jgi:hypothetical protein
MLPDIVQNHFISFKVPGRYGATIGENISTSASMGEIFENLFKKPLS